MRLGSLVVLALVSTSCGDRSSSTCEPDLSRSSGLDAPIPQHFLRSTEGTVAFSDNTPATNPITSAGAALGRALFYDRRLSANDRIACASCHHQEFGFGDTARFSPGLHGAPTRRHVLALANARFNDGRFFWDERSGSLEEQVLVPITDSLEMGMTLGELAKKLGVTSSYPSLFRAAFGSAAITREGIARALAQFVRSLVSSGSRLDAVFASGGAPDWGLLSPEEREGQRLFHAVGCVNCHRAITQFADRANNVGLDREPADSGAGGGRFKAPSLRNVAVRAPYMHDGRFRTLREVVKFYSEGVQPSPELDPRLRNDDGMPRRLGLDSVQVSALVAFLRALTDSAFLKAERFGDPFSCHDKR